MSVTNPYPVDSATRTCCGGIGRHARDCSFVAPPPGAEAVDNWETDSAGLPYRAIFGANHAITDHEATVYTAVTQLSDGSLENSGLASPGIYVTKGDFDGLDKLNSDQARELAAALLECAAELDGWVQR